MFTHHKTLLMCEHKVRGVRVVSTVGFINNEVVFLLKPIIVKG